MDTVNNELLRAAAAIGDEEKRAEQDGVTISQARSPRDTYLAGYLDGLNKAGHIARGLPARDF